ncbi:podoplanin, isoform CRA_a [Mus musculus]|nr:podoplanin, isoform CRA_a [Mus musculus]EDL13426.1 podoplanin, isoform CRA_a [Mus musculus]
MWTVPVLFWVLGSVWFWDSAQGGTIGVNEDDIVTPGTGDGMVPPGIEDKITTTGATGGLNESTGKAPLVWLASSHPGWNHSWRLVSHWLRRRDLHCCYEEDFWKVLALKS